jgi:hypothetical protein
MLCKGLDIIFIGINYLGQFIDAMLALALLILVASCYLI